MITFYYTPTTIRIFGAYVRTFHLSFLFTHRSHCYCTVAGHLPAFLIRFFSFPHVCTVRQFQIVCLLFCLFLSQTFCILFSAQFFFSMPVINFMEMHQWCLFVCANSGITYASKHEADVRRALHVMLNILP